MLDNMKGSYLSPEFSQQEIESRLTTLGAKFTAHTDEELVDACANALVDEKALGWFQGRMEFGPRALGGDRFWVMRDPPACNRC